MCIQTHTRIYVYYYYVSCLSAGPWTCSIDKLSFPSIRTSASSFSSQHHLLFLKSSRSCVLLLPFPFTSSCVFQWHHEGDNSFSEYNQTNWLFYVGYYLKVSYSIRSRSLLLTFSDHFVFSIFRQHHISKLSKYFRSNFLSVQISEPYKEMLQT